MDISGLSDFVSGPQVLAPFAWLLMEDSGPAAFPLGGPLPGLTGAGCHGGAPAAA